MALQPQMLFTNSDDDVDSVAAFKACENVGCLKGWLFKGQHVAQNADTEQDNP